MCEMHQGRAERREPCETLRLRTDENALLPAVNFFLNEELVAPVLPGHSMWIHLLQLLSGDVRAGACPACAEKGLVGLARTDLLDKLEVRLGVAFAAGLSRGLIA